MSVVAQRTIRYVGIGSITFQALGCADELVYILNDLRTKKPISTVHLAQFGAQCFFLALSVKNFQLTEKLTSAAGTRNVKSIRRIIRQHNSDGSIRYLFAASDFMEKNVEGLSFTPMLLKTIFEGCLNVSSRVRNECEKEFNTHINSITADIEKKYEIKLRTLFELLLEMINFKSLKILLELSEKFMDKSFQLYTVKRFDYYLKALYMAIFTKAMNNDFNGFILSIQQTGIDDLIDEINTEFIIIKIDLSEEFDKTFKSNVSSGLPIGRQIHLVIQHRSEIIINQLKQSVNSVDEGVEYLCESVEYILKRLTHDGVTLFFRLVKTILNEGVLQMPMPEAIRIIFQQTVKKFNGNLTALENSLKTHFLYKESFDEYKKDFIDKFLSKNALKLKDCPICGGHEYL